MTSLPTVVYPTLSSSLTPTPLSDMVCDQEPVRIVCKATACVVRSKPESGEANIAYTVPYNTVLDGVAVCICPDCAPMEKNWFLGKSGENQLWALKMDQVWEVQGE